jgi:hypothetical protein
LRQLAVRRHAVILAEWPSGSISTDFTAESEQAARVQA